MSLRKFSKRKRRYFAMPEISLTPLIDTALTLLIIFIVTAPMVQNGIKISLPQGKSKEAGTQQDFVITLSKSGEIYFNSFHVAKHDLCATVSKALEGKWETPIFVRADEAVSYGNVIEIVDSLKQSGVRYVAMSTKPLINASAS